MDLADIHYSRHAGIDLRQATEQFGNIDIFGPVEDGELLQDPFIVICRTLRPPVIDQDRVGKQASKCGLELMVVGIDEAWHADRKLPERTGP